MINKKEITKKKQNIIVITVIILVILILLIISKNKHNLDYINEAVYAATRMLISDSNNKVILKNQCNNQEFVSISQIKYGDNQTLNVKDDKIFVAFLSNNYYLSVPDVKKKKDLDTRLNEEKSYVIVKYDCEKKEFIYADFSKRKEEKGKSWMEWE